MENLNDNDSQFKPLCYSEVPLHDGNGDTHRTTDDNEDDGDVETNLLPVVDPMTPLQSRATTPPPSSSSSSLSWPLALLFGLDGIALALPMTALLYIVNDRVQMPLSLLPSYAAVAFLPCSLKPAYAAASSRLLSSSWRIPRPAQIAGLWVGAALASAATAHIAPRQVGICFGVAFVRCVCSAWPEFLLGLTLIDEAVVAAAATNANSNAADDSTANANAAGEDPNERALACDDPRQPLNFAIQEPLPPRPPATPTSYNTVAALFQSQSATARSIGCVVAHLLVLLFFSVLQAMQQQQPTSSSQLIEAATLLTDTTVTILFLATALVQIAGAVIVWTFRVGSSVQPNDCGSTGSSRNPPPDTTTCCATSVATGTNNTLLEPLLLRVHTVSRQTSYDSINVPPDTEDPALARKIPVPWSKLSNALEVETLTPSTSTTPLVDRLLPPNSDSVHTTELLLQQQLQPIQKSWSGRNIGLVVLIQILVVFLSVRQPLAQATSYPFWNGFVAVLLVALLGLGGGGCVPWSNRVGSDGNSSSVAKSFEYSNRVGLFLILRHAVPSVSYLMSSYFYTVFATTAPAILQVLSLWDMIITTAACWTFGKFWSQYSHGQQLYWLMAGTTALAAAASLGNVALIRLLDPSKTSQHQHQQYSLVWKVIWTVLIKTVLGFTSEWKFLPDIVLATVAAVDATCPSTAACIPVACDTSEAGVTNHASWDVAAAAKNASDEVPRQFDASTGHQHHIGMRYGTLVSCIDFGGQLGALLAGPVVAFFGASRDNGWHHLDWLQELNSFAVLCSIPLIFLLVQPLRITND